MPDRISEGLLGEVSDEALIRAALDEETYDKAVRDRVRSELHRRGLSIEDYADHILVKARDAVDTLSIHDALVTFDEMEAWSPVEWTNAVRDRVTIQRNQDDCLIHSIGESGYIASSRQDVASARSQLEAFLRLQVVVWDGAFDINTWPVVDASKSPLFLKRLEQELAHRSVEHIVVCPGPESDDRTCDIRVPSNRTRAAEEALSDLYDRIEHLRQQARALAETDQREKELEIYDLLRDLTPDRASVVYNRAAVLYELGDLNGALDGFLEALSIGMPEENLSRYRGNRTGLFQMALTSRQKNNPEYFEDIEAFLLKIEPERPDSVPLLHGLATLARMNDRGDRALGYYGRILDLDPNDQAARTNVALLQEDTHT